MKRELQIFLTAVMFYTRIPCPRWVDHDPAFISLSTRYFPLIGWIVGGVYGGAIIVSMMVFPPFISIVLGLIVSVLLTGAFHEDGFADVCDGFGGGWTKEKILSIMKDSRVGTYAVVGLLLLFALKLSTTLSIIPTLSLLPLLLLLVSSHSLSRAMAVVVIYCESYAKDEADSKAKPVAVGISVSNLIIAMCFGVAPFLYFLSVTDFRYALALIPLIIVTLYLMRYFKKWIGGYTGDCLGATQQINETLFLISTLAVWKFI